MERARVPLLPRISVNQNKVRIPEKTASKLAKAILGALGFTDAELSILIVDDEEMARINGEYRGVDETTDVLSFPMAEGEFGDICPEMLGDVVISAPTAQEMADLHGCSLEDVIALLLVHGVLHLTGLDHEESDDAARQTDEKTLQLLSAIGKDPSTFGWYATAG